MFPVAKAGEEVAEAFCARNVESSRDHSGCSGVARDRCTVSSPNFTMTAERLHGIFHPRFPIGMSARRHTFGRTAHFRQCADVAQPETGSFGIVQIRITVGHLLGQALFGGLVLHSAYGLEEATRA